MFKGSSVALITPYKNGAVNEKKLIELVEWHISEGTNGLVPVGTTGESATLSNDEHVRVIEIVTKAARKRVPVIAGTGSNSTKEAIDLTGLAKDLGVDAVLLVNPYYNRPTQEGLFAHFSAIAEAVNIPIILYNIPSRSGVNMLPETIVALAQKNKNIVGVKEASGSVDQSSEIKGKLGDSFCLLSGDDSMTLPLMAVGADGVISVAANLVPADVSQLCRYALEGNYAAAREIHLKMYPLIKALFMETSPSPVKTAMFEAGLIDDESLRLPMVNVKPETRKKIVSVMKEYGVKSFSPVVK